jgi:hypothetical protein
MGQLLLDFCTTPISKAGVVSGWLRKEKDEHCARLE